MSLRYYYLPKGSDLDADLMIHFAEYQANKKALIDALNKWGTPKSCRIFGSGRNMALTNMENKPGWKYVRSRDYYKPDPKTIEGKQVIEDMKNIPNISHEHEDLSNKILDHGLAIIGTDDGLMILHANFDESTELSHPGFVITSPKELPEKCKRWPSSAIEITGTRAEELTKPTEKHNK